MELFQLIDLCIKRTVFRKKETQELNPEETSVE